MSSYDFIFEQAVDLNQFNDQIKKELGKTIFNIQIIGKPMLKYIIIIQLLFSSAFSDCRQMYLSFHYVEGVEFPFEMEEFLYGENNCCDEYPISFCEEGTIYYEKDI